MTTVNSKKTDYNKQVSDTNITSNIKDKTIEYDESEKAISVILLIIALTIGAMSYLSMFYFVLSEDNSKYIKIKAKVIVNKYDKNSYPCQILIGYNIDNNIYSALIDIRDKYRNYEKGDTIEIEVNTQNLYEVRLVEISNYTKACLCCICATLLISLTFANYYYRKPSTEKGKNDG